MGRVLLLLLGRFLYRRVEGSLDSYKAGTVAAQPHTSSWTVTLLRLLWWLLR